jgi:ammonium transporter, Amt family
VFKKYLLIGLTAFLLVNSLILPEALADTMDVAKELSELQTKIDAAQTAGDNSFMLISSALVLLMTPGLAFFYGGFVAKRNVLNTLMMSFLLMGIVGVTWVLWGYSLSFATGNPFIGGLEWFGLNGVSATDTSGYIAEAVDKTGVKSYAATIPHQTFMIYQAMFAIITPALISGAIVERVSFTAYTWFMILWSTFIYCPLAHMVWGNGGFLGLYGGMGALDFAGGTVVHISSGVSALVAALVIGSRKKYPSSISAPHNVPFILLGAGLLWFGWFGFNAGSALSAGGLATSAFVSTNSATAAAMLTWLLLEKFLREKPTAVGAATGAVAGLVGITPAAGFVTPLSAILIGSITSLVCFFAVSFKAKLRIDDALDTYPVHGVGGTVGAILTGVFATAQVNSLIGKTDTTPSHEGLLSGNPSQVLTQIIAVLIAYLVAGVGTFVILKILQATVGLRVTEQEEQKGLDITEHGEEGYGEEFGGGLSYVDAEASAGK